MSHVLRAFGWLLLGLGLFIALFPFISVWRVSGQVLYELPEISELESTDDRNRLGAMFDGDFVLATRTYRDAALDVVLGAYVSDGWVGSRSRFSKQCCSEYDEVWVEVQESDSGSVVVVLTAADADVQGIWPFFALFGIGLAFAGRSVAGSARRSESLSESVLVS